MKNETKIPKLVCSVWREDSREYGHVTLAYYTGASLDRYCPQPFLMLKWQCDPENNGWYALHTEISRDSAADMLVAIQAAQSVLRKIDELPSCTPAAVFAAVGAPQWIEDRRCSRWIPIEQVKSADYQRWMSWTDGQCNVAVMATDEDDARDEIMAEFARRITDCNGSYGAKLEAWISAGKPVRLDDWAKAPDTTPLEVLFKPLHETAPAASENLVSVIS